jgi:hypothetical protein
VGGAFPHLLSANYQDHKGWSTPGMDRERGGIEAPPGMVGGEENDHDDDGSIPSIERRNSRTLIAADILVRYP